MQPYRITARSVPRACRQGSCGPAASSNSGRNFFTAPAFFPAAHHNYFNPAAEFNGLFRLLDNAASELIGPSSRGAARRSFTPRFDVKENATNFELKGELPGIQQKDLQIEFTDEKTLVIRGSSEREFTNSNVDASKAVEEGQETAKAVDNATATDDAASEKSGNSNYHKASVEDEYVDAGAEAEKSGDNANTDVAAATPSAEAAAATETKAAEPAYKYWVSERSVGEFERHFAFPGRVDQEAVTASLKNGILSVVVPKIVQKEARKIEVQ